MEIYHEIADTVVRAFRQIESKVSPPEFVMIGNHKQFRYKESTLEAAIVQKSARLISGLNASLVLLKAGYVQELGALFRMLDEFSEDILFLCQGVGSGEITELHQMYLDAFYQEEFDEPHNPLKSSQKRPMVSRRKIQAAISRIPEQELNPSDAQAIYRTLNKTYSGYVHAASPHVMEMYGGNPPRFHVSGMLGTPRMAEFVKNTWDYSYRTLNTIMIVALTFKQEELVKQLYGFRNYIEEKSGKTDWEHPETIIKNTKNRKP